MKKIQIKFNSEEKELAESFASKNDGEVSLLEDGSGVIEIASYDEKAESTANEVDKLYDYVSKRCEMYYRWCQERMNYMQKDFYEHLKGHLPSVKSKEQLKRAIDALGLNEEYEVKPTVIYASNSHDKNTLEVELKIPQKD